MNVAEALHLPIRSERRIRVANKELARIHCAFVLALCDVVALCASFLGANALYMGALSHSHGMTMATVLTPIYVIVATLNLAYSGDALGSAWLGISRAVQAFIVAAGAILFIAYFLKAGSEFSRVVFALGSVGSLILLPTVRLLLRGPILNLLGGVPYTTVVIQDGAHYTPYPHEVVVTPADLEFDPVTSDPMRYHAFSERVANADRLIIACSEDRYVLWSTVLKSMAIDGEILTDEQDSLGIIGVNRHGGRRTLVVSTGPLHLRERLLKRSFDLAVSLVSILLLLPLFLLVTLAIRIDSRGPALFRQERIGRDNKIFGMYKFRSMYSEMCDPKAEKLTGRSDARVTRVGAFIRKTSIDELPQLLNVIRGDMSIVGPRPHAISAKAANILYWDVDPRYRHRHSMKPGLTGLAQIRGFRGATDRAEDLTNRLQADLEYVQDWSIWKDIWIIMRTLRVLFHDNAF